MLSIKIYSLTAARNLQNKKQNIHYCIECVKVIIMRVIHLGFYFFIIPCKNTVRRKLK